MITEIPWHKLKRLPAKRTWHEFMTHERRIEECVIRRKNANYTLYEYQDANPSYTYYLVEWPDICTWGQETILITFFCILKHYMQGRGDIIDFKGKDFSFFPSNPNLLLVLMTDK